ncbi:AAA family ATPase [Alkaliphilus peptidifermentans]|uniref:AAA domain-containing protein n=1 Tax=Alkaliphilus peptidifermentans DSM 18978 TaxID=1120976 RepID=A0A1G5L6J8_9FIRM|nr:AAA family ATPase [Alkaliphilus peptidifermentans]SCZ08497.1 AAA domain-containing protein [Alkaliphilus peptidifermentans DSM 18978]
MIIWLNGAFGSGKTTCAFELNRRLPNSFIYDPENIGYFIRKNTPKETQRSDFQNHEQWRFFNYEMLKYISHEYAGTLIVPMTINNRQYYEEIIQRLMDDGVVLKHFILYADKETILKRLNMRLERGDTWAKSQIDRCIEAFNNDITEEKIITDNRSIDYIVEEIANRSGINLLPDKRIYLKKLIDRAVILIKHIR